MSTVVDALIGKIFSETCSNRGGELADYIPELAAVPPIRSVSA